MMKLILNLVLISLCLTQENYTITNTETRAFKSELLNEDLQLIVSYPFGYSKSTEQYPVLFVLDADVMFGITSQIPQLMSFEKTIKPFVQVGIAYGGGIRNWLQKRNRDYVPNKENVKQKGAGLFLSVLEKELIPYLKKELRVKSISLYGHSFGGLFSLYALKEKPELFNTIFASSPSVEWNNNWYIKNYKTPKIGKTKVYISVGGRENIIIESLKPVLKELKKDFKYLKYTEYKNQTHMSVISAAFTDGIQWIFK